MNTISPQIVYYDRARLDSLSYYLAGFQMNQRSHRCRFKVVQRPPQFLKEPELIGSWQRHLAAVGLFKYRAADTEFYFCIDRSDHSTNKMDQGYLLPLLERVRYYFKANYNPDGIAADPRLSAYHNKIVPILSSFPISVPKRLPFFPHTFSRNNPIVRRARERIQHIYRLPTLKDYNHWRGLQRDLDVFMVMIYYQQSHHREKSRFRAQVMRALAKRRHLKTSVGFVSQIPLPKDVADLEHPRLNMRTYLEQLARSKVAIYVRGPHDGISSKFGQLMALGKPIVGQSLANNRERLYSFPSIERQFAFDEPEALVARVDDLLQKPEELDRLARSNADIFDRYLNPKAIVTGLLSFIDDTLVHADTGRERKDVNVVYALNA